MNTAQDNIVSALLSIFQFKVSSGPITDTMVKDEVDAFIRAHGVPHAMRDGLIAAMERNFQCFVGEHSALHSQSASSPWVTESLKVDWRYWNRYRAFVAGRFASPVVAELDRSTDKIMNFLGNPKAPSSFDRRGLVVGDIQSGKTANMLGLANKAADCGYEYIIVLSGTDNDLRAQTQARVDEGVIGKRTACPLHAKDCRCQNRREHIGVGKINPAVSPHWITTLQQDFRRVVAGPGISVRSDPVIAVVKKNARILDTLLAWLERQLGTVGNDGARTRSATTILVIDDECDTASIDTKKKDDAADADHDPTRINALIRSILGVSSRSAYVGYTGTPYANILIHAKSANEENGDDLFPRDFIVTLQSPTNYLGAERLFGLGAGGSHPDEQDLDGRGAAGEGLPELITIITDNGGPEDKYKTGWLPGRHNKHSKPEGKLPSSLIDAICHFLIGCAARHQEHNSMLVNVTRFTDVQKAVRREVEASLRALVDDLRYDDDAAWQRMERIWSRRIGPARAAAARAFPSEKTDFDWAEIKDRLVAVADQVAVMEINGQSEDALRYISGRPVRVIAIGGQKLSRGLTMEGLTVSYFTRLSKMYDTLLQMGRWFGYRSGYVGLCGLYIQAEVRDAFQALAEISSELRELIDDMDGDGSPEQFRLRIRSHPSMIVTAPNKMRDTVTVDLSYSGTISETKIFEATAADRARNRAAMEGFLEGLGFPSNGPAPFKPVSRTFGGKVSEWPHAYLWHDIAAADICSLLRRYTTHPDATKAQSRRLLEFIERRNRTDGTLRRWNVAFMSRGSHGPDVRTIAGLSYLPRLRSPDPTLKLYESVMENGKEIDRINQRYLDARGAYVTKRLVTETDELIDVTEEMYAKALARQARDLSRAGVPAAKKRPNFLRLREQRAGGNGLLMVYPIVPDLLGRNIEWRSDEEHFFGLAFVFPGEADSRQYVMSTSSLEGELSFDDDWED